MSLAFEYIIFALDARALLLYNYDKRPRIFSYILLIRNHITFLVQLKCFSKTTGSCNFVGL